MASPTVAPVLSTPSDIILEQDDVVEAHRPQLSIAQLDIQYEIKRTVEEIRANRWKRIALQFPDEMLHDAPNVFDRLRAVLQDARQQVRTVARSDVQAVGQVDSHQDSTSYTPGETDSDDEEKLSILGDTSYGACCVDEIAAEHVSADGVVHYGRSCLSPTQRLPVIYVYTSQPIDLEQTVLSFEKTFPSKLQSICIMADIPWQSHVQALAKQLREGGYTSIIAPHLIHDPGSVLPNRDVHDHTTTDMDALKNVSLWHIGKPPTALLLTLTSRVKEIFIYDPLEAARDSSVTEANTSIPLRRRYASLLTLSSAAVIGILINTLSVKNYLSALRHVQDLITTAGKKSYTFVVGKLNPPKLANFAEVQGWVVIGCWESSLIDSRDFLAPVVTPFELEVALAKDGNRIWGQEWISDFESLLRRKREISNADVDITPTSTQQENGDEVEFSDEDQPPEFDLRTGRYVSHTRPIHNGSHARSMHIDHDHISSLSDKPSTALVQRPKGGVATVNGVISSGAEYLRSKRNWQGLGSDFAVEYDRDENGNIQGAMLEQGRNGVAKGYSHSTDPATKS